MNARTGMKRLVVLGSTGSVGENVLDVVRRFPDRFQVVGLGARSNVGVLKEQVRAFHPRQVAVVDSGAASRLAAELGGEVEVLSGSDGLVALGGLPEADMVVMAIAGGSGLPAVMEAVKAGKQLALASKEVLVMAGELVVGQAAVSGAQILPVDSEHSAIFQAMQGHKREELRRVILTASGGPFLDYSESRMREVTVEEALNHPTWNMGKKISVDSATLMNKGLEVIEAHWLFGLPMNMIDIHIHPESVVHSLLEFKDGSVIAHMAITDMRLPIAYALSYPERLEMNLPTLDLVKVVRLTFLEPDGERFPALPLARAAGRDGGSMPTVLNAANEVAVDAFLRRELSFHKIPEVVAATMECHNARPLTSLDDVLGWDSWARVKAHEMVEARRLRG